MGSHWVLLLILFVSVPLVNKTAPNMEITYAVSHVIGQVNVGKEV